MTNVKMAEKFMKIPKCVHTLNKSSAKEMAKRYRKMGFKAKITDTSKEGYQSYKICGTPTKSLQKLMRKC